MQYDVQRKFFPEGEGLYSKQVVKYLLYAAEMIAALLWQVTPQALPEVCGGKAVILVPLALSFAVFEREIPAMLSAVGCGMLADGACRSGNCFYVIVLLIACYAVSAACQYYIRRTLLTVMLLAVIIIPVILLLQFLLYYVCPGYPEAGYMLVRHYLARIVYTLTFMPLCYALNRLLAIGLKPSRRWLKDGKRLSEGALVRPGDHGSDDSGPISDTVSQLADRTGRSIQGTYQSQGYLYRYRRCHSRRNF